MCGRGGGWRISAFPALGGGGNSESPGEGDPGGWPGAGDRRFGGFSFFGGVGIGGAIA